MGVPGPPPAHVARRASQPRPCPAGGAACTGRGGALSSPAGPSLPRLRERPGPAAQSVDNSTVMDQCAFGAWEKPRKGLNGSAKTILPRFHLLKPEISEGQNGSRATKTKMLLASSLDIDERRQGAKMLTILAISSEFYHYQ